MTEQKKISRLESLEFEDFRGLFLEILERIGYEEITSLPIQNHFVSASIKSGLKSNRDIFYMATDTLSGANENKNIESIAKELMDYSKENNCYSFFLVSTNYISNGFKKKVVDKSEGLALDFQGRDSLIELIEKHHKDFWKHDDRLLINYENNFTESLEEDDDLKKLKIFDEKYDKVLKIFIEPRIYSIGEDIESNKPTRKKISLSSLCEEIESKIIAGDAGAGKSTLLKRIGQSYIEMNRESSSPKKNIPIYVSSLDLIESDYNLQQTIEKHLETFFDDSLKELTKVYQLVLLLDSIDEFSTSIQKSILQELEEITDIYDINYILGTRNSEQILDNKEESKAKVYQIDKFNQDQIRKYVENFFPQNTSRAESLLDALRDNRILERLPITPLTLSLVSILYEERNFEIPATIADIYDNFNHLLLGKATVSSRIEFIDISFAQRILSLYAFELLHRDSLTPMTLDEFISYFEEYFKNKSSNLGTDQLNKFLNHLTNNSGILELKDGKFVQFKHNSFLEYYAAQEYFKHERNDNREAELVENFFDPIWQNTSIFYGGMSRDMPEFLKKVIKKVQSANMFPQYFASVNGLGYLIQALYQTDNQIRRDGIKQAIETNLEAFELFKKLAHDKQVMFKNHKLPILSLINLTFFYENFNSIALKHPLEMCFQDYLSAYQADKFDVNSGYRALKVALTLNSPRLDAIEHLEKLIDETEITSNPYLSLIAHFAISLNENSNEDLKKELKKSLNKNPKIVKEIQGASLSKMRFSPLDSIHPKRKVKLIVEGKTDVQIIEHAFMVLRNGERPYWNIDYPKHKESGGARAVGDVLNGSISTINPNEFVIGIFDNDSEGQQMFNGHINTFAVQEDRRIKKAPNVNVYGLKLPIPQRIKHYYNEKQSFNFFEIEHYFSEEFLRENGKLKDTGIPKVFEFSGSKSTFANKVTKVIDNEVFRDFIDLFKLIDFITNEEIDYLN
ncbi:NACHT domain-containing protein [uncultured Aquimarina sp.]|uniref:NACHT domain-containing protein n=1 Tax=uncultured Aquimarina sp. TaxID=575652 RepID=UPI002630DCD6|nr:NACHT domain-containing protein [uncultured Aquimarina sp.]